MLTRKVKCREPDNTRFQNASAGWNRRLPQKILPTADRLIVHAGIFDVYPRFWKTDADCHLHPHPHPRTPPNEKTLPYFMTEWYRNQQHLSTVWKIIMSDMRHLVPKVQNEFAMCSSKWSLKKKTNGEKNTMVNEKMVSYGRYETKKNNRTSWCTCSLPYILAYKASLHIRRPLKHEWVQKWINILMFIHFCTF